jgi:hypothetical protein
MAMHKMNTTATELVLLWTQFVQNSACGINNENLPKTFFQHVALFTENLHNQTSGIYWKPTLQETIYSVIEKFRHRSLKIHHKILFMMSLKIRHKILFMMFSGSVMYWASQIKLDDVFFKIVTYQRNLWCFFCCHKTHLVSCIQAQAHHSWRNWMSQMFATWQPTWLVMWIMIMT